MLTAIATIVDHAIEKKEFLVSKRAVWADPYFPDLKNRIEKDVIEFLGINSVAELRSLTYKVTSARAEATNKIAELKVQIKEDFKNEKPIGDHILANLGLMSGGKMVRIRNLDYQNFNQLLKHVKSGLTQEVRKQIEDKGTAPALLDDIIRYADEFFQLNTLQEVQKSSRSSLANSAISELNNVYSEVISIAKIARTFLKGAPKAERDKFSFSAILRRQGGSATVITKDNEAQ